MCVEIRLVIENQTSLKSVIIMILGLLMAAFDGVLNSGGKM